MTSRKSPTWPSGFRTTAWERDAPNKVWRANYCRDCRTNCIYYYYLKLVSTHYNREQSCLNPLGICEKSAKDAHGNQGQGVWMHTTQSTEVRHPPGGSSLFASRTCLKSPLTYPLSSNMSSPLSRHGMSLL